MPGFGLRTRFFLYSNTLIVVTMTIAATLTIAHERRSRYEAIERRARSICEAMAIPITDALMYDDLGLVVQHGLIDNYIHELEVLNRDVKDPRARGLGSRDRIHRGTRRSQSIGRHSGRGFQRP